MIKHLYLDLEGTIITPVPNGWWEAELINVGRIRAFVREFQPDLIHLFSFAIRDEQERGDFNRTTRDTIERVLGQKLTDVPTCSGDIIPVVSRAKGLREDLSFFDLAQKVGKQEAFRLYVRQEFAAAEQQVEVALLDDVVTNEEFNWSNLKIKGHIINVDKLGR